MFLQTLVCCITYLSIIHFNCMQMETLSYSALSIHLDTHSYGWAVFEYCTYTAIIILPCHKKKTNKCSVLIYLSINSPYCFPLTYQVNRLYIVYGRALSSTCTVKGILYLLLSSWVLLMQLFQNTCLLEEEVVGHSHGIRFLSDCSLEVFQLFCGGLAVELSYYRKKLVARACSP